MPKLGSQIIFNSKKANFARDHFDTLAAMRAVDTRYIDKGHISYCKETDKHYTFQDTDVSYDSTTGYWRELTSSVFQGASADRDGKEGLVPKPLYSQRDYYLKGNGTWSKAPIEDIIIGETSIVSRNKATMPLAGIVNNESVLGVMTIDPEDSVLSLTEGVLKILENSIYNDLLKDDTITKDKITTDAGLSDDQLATATASTKGGILLGGIFSTDTSGKLTIAINNTLNISNNELGVSLLGIKTEHIANKNITLGKLSDDIQEAIGAIKWEDYTELVKHNNKCTREQALILTETHPNVVYFLTDSPTIITNGEEYIGRPQCPIYRIKGSVATVADLDNITMVEEYDVYNVKDKGDGTGGFYQYISSEWIEVGMPDLSGYATTEAVASVILGIEADIQEVRDSNVYLTEDEYQELIDEGTVDPNKTYFIYEE